VKLLGHTDIITEVDFARSGAHILTSSLDFTVRLWTKNSNSPSNSNSYSNKPTGSTLWNSTAIKTHGSCIRTCAFSEDSKYFLTGSDDKTVKLYET
jgi:WD40 repeat protein